MIPWQQAFMEWQAKVATVGEEKAGPPPKMPELSISSSPYMATVTDPVAGGVRDMMVNALLNSNRFIVLERQAIDEINWEQEFSQSGRVGERTKLPIGQIEGAELLLIGSLTTLEGEQSGGGVAGTLSEFIWSLANTPLANVDVGVSWKTAKAAMEIRVIDTRTSRIVAATTVEGHATDIGLGGSKRSSSSYYDEGPLSASFSAIQKTPVGEAFRKMVHAAVEFLITKTPENFFRITAE
jgi:curli biogenesis system outer membrane secretion channel CsgG